jgi:hypothetical protein
MDNDKDGDGDHNDNEEFLPVIDHVDDSEREDEESDEGEDFADAQETVE